MIRIRALFAAALVAVGALAVVACGGTISTPNATTPGATVTGTLLGTEFVAEDAFSGSLSLSSDPANPSYALVVGIADTAGVCDRFARGAKPKSTRLVALVLTDTDANGKSVAVHEPGVYTTFDPSGPNPGKRAAALVTITDAACDESKYTETAGTVTIDSIDGDAVRGSADVTLKNGDHFTVTFRTASCPAAVTSQANPTCE